jgi:hypothetical protein
MITSPKESLIVMAILEWLRRTYKDEIIKTQESRLDKTFWDVVV